MKIEDRLSNYMALLNSGATKPAPKSGGVPGSQNVVGTPPDAVALSSKAVELADDAARRERLSIIQKQLAEGSYNISGKDVADKMLNILKG